MAGISVVQYNTSHKMNVLQQSTKSNNNERRDVIIVRKPTQNKCGDVLITNTAKKKMKSGKEVQQSGIQQNPPPIAVARRNARERNRVKQVNNGFATLRQHIPNSIAASFEGVNGRGGNKKLSKVETLRMAVEYIRSLEDLLTCSDDNISEGVLSSSNFSTFSSPAVPSSPTVTTASCYTYALKSPPEDDDEMSMNSTPSPPQYIRINRSSNSYQIMYENCENLEPLSEHMLDDSSLIRGGGADLEFDDVQDLSLLNSLASTTSMSPDIYSESSLSPGSLEKNNVQSYAPLAHVRDCTSPPEVKFNVADVKDIEHPVISLHTNMQISQEHKENLVHVMAWWEQHASS